MNPEEYGRCLAHLRPRYQLREDERSVLQYRYCGNIKIFKYKIFYKGGASMTIGDFFTMAAVIVAACLVYNFVKAYTKKK